LLLRDYTGDPTPRETALAKPNYSFEKRQREIAKKKEQELKDARKREAREAAKAANAETPSNTTEEQPDPPGAA
jgi:hypothetical protein